MVRSNDDYKQLCRPYKITVNTISTTENESSMDYQYHGMYIATSILLVSLDTAR